MIADTTRLREEVGWRKDFNLTDDLKKAFEWWKRSYENLD
jgi:nucleoside-diphosphate-sugar epimerase